MPVLRVIMDRYLVPPAQGHRGRRNHDLAKRADALEVVNRHGQPGLFFNLDPKRQMIPVDYGTPCRQVERVLDGGYGVCLNLVLSGSGQFQSDVSNTARAACESVGGALVISGRQ